MDKSIERLQDILASVRVGRASPGGARHGCVGGVHERCMSSSITALTWCTGMLDHLKVDAYGERMSLKSLGSVSVRDNQLLAVSAFDPGVCGCFARFLCPLRRPATCLNLYIAHGRPEFTR